MPNRLRRAGCRVRYRAVPALSRARRLLDTHGSLVNAEAVRTYRHVLHTPHADQVDPHIMRRLRTAAAHDDESAYRFLLDERARLRGQAAAELRGTVLMMPTVRCTAPRADGLADAGAFAAVNDRVLANTMTTSVLDLPGITVPAGTGRSGLPVGVLVSAPAGALDELVSVSTLVESLTRDS